MFAALVSAAMVWSVATPVAHASPEDPYGEDWVALAVAPFAPEMLVTWGTAGTQDEAVRIAMDFCNQRSGGHPCYVGATTEYGCVAVDLNHRSRSFTNGQGPNEAAAMQDAANKTASDADPEGFGRGSVQCSIPSTPPQ